MNKGKRITLVLSTILMLCFAAMPVWAEPKNPEEDSAAVTDEVTDAAEETPDAPADWEITEEEITTEETTTEVTTTYTTVVRTEMTPPDPLAMIKSEENADGVTITSFRWTCEETVEIPAKINGKPVTEIAEKAFKYCYADAVLLPDTVTKIGDRAFEGCAYLQSMTLPKACVSIGEAAFSGCKALETVALPDNVQDIGQDAFADTPFLSQQTGDAVILGNGILYAYCGTASEYTVPDNVKIIGANAFAGTESLKKVTIPKGVTQIQQGAFAGCTALSEIIAPDTIGSLAADAFADTKWMTNNKEDYLILGKMLLAYCGKDSVAEVPDGIEIINAEAFAGQNGITTVHLPESVREVHDDAFRDCSSLQVVEFGDNLTVIGADAFRNCRTLNYLRLGHALETIGDHAFAGCASLVEVYLPDTVNTIGEQAFGYGYDEEKGYLRMKNEMVLYANSSAVREYAKTEDIAHEPLPDAENTEPAPVVTEPENASAGFGQIRGTAWIPAVGLGGILVLVGGVTWFIRRKKESAD